jgi:hypothetical protein
MVDAAVAKVPEFQLKLVTCCVSGFSRYCPTGINSVKYASPAASGGKVYLTVSKLLNLIELCPIVPVVENWANII